MTIYLRCLNLKDSDTKKSGCFNNTSNSLDYIL